MTDNKTIIHKILQKNNGIISASEVTAMDIPRRVLTEMVKNGELCKADRGVYVLPEVWEDEFFIHQYRLSRGVYSHETALYLLGYSDRTPSSFTMTFQQGYNTAHTKDRIIPKVVVNELYDLGVVDVDSPSGNPLKVYCIERTLCDIVKGNGAMDISIVNNAMKQYAQSRDKNIALLMDYAEKLRVKPKIQNYMEVLL